MITLSDEERSLSEDAAGAGCQSQQLRFFKGYSTQEPQKPWPSTGDPIPGPTLRARVGDLVQLTFLNQVDLSKFPNTLDQGEQGKTNGCDEATAQRVNSPNTTTQIYPRNDNYPNCLHGSSTANLHFHGTHTTPSTTGDNVLLFVRPALRQGDKIEPEDSFVMAQFKEFFNWCAANGTPQKWTQMPSAWQAKQKELLETYDKTAPYKGVPGDLPPEMRLWPRNEAQLQQGLWPQYNVGAFPYCFSLPVYDPAKVKMGQSPGTHWYHAHKHGSTALNVGNGMTGTFVIEGAYDDALRKFYKETPSHKNWGLQEQVLVIQQLETSLNLLSGTNKGGPAPLSVNGRLNPVVTMKPGQVQMWRIVNTAPRNFVQFDSFTQRGQGGQSPAWRQIAQDGVQLSYTNYQRIGTVNAKFNLAAANRADLLVRAPVQEGEYELKVVESISDLPSGTPTTLLTVRVKADAKPIDPPMDFIEREADFPELPAFLADITEPIYMKRELHFNTNPSSARAGKGQMPLHEINDKLFDGHHVDQTMILNTTEEWTLFNETTNIAHPFHIHINPFQIVEVFQPNTSSAKDTSSPCYADPTKPATWKPCQKLAPPFVWWDVFAIPTARQDKLPTSVCTTLDQCPEDIQQYTACTGGTCTVTIPGYFKMRSRFVDFTGQYVLHCHILAHEDRGMMELVEVIPRSESYYKHH
ncbi:MAG TPA: multicopper oxidase domain-containing protein [Thermoanaerobaculia bacterium]|nr:multicopper oxidase domain-containing protein [Thermoanaerobaculia bacterium]